MKTITHSELLQILKEKKGVVICGLMSVVDGRARKKNNPIGQIFKLTRSVGFSGADYQKAVNREGLRQDVEADFISAKLPFGSWFLINKVIKHNEEFYLRIQMTPNQRRVQPPKVIYLNSNGEILDYEDIKEYLPLARESAKQQEHGLNETVMVRCYKFSNILKIRIGGQTYKLLNNLKVPENPYKAKPQRIVKHNPEKLAPLYGPLPSIKIIRKANNNTK